MAVHAKHIEPGDPRYDGFRIEQLWVLCMVDPADNQEGAVWIEVDAARRHNLAPGAAFASDQRRREHLEAYAEELAANGARCTLKHFVYEGEQAYG